jgi:starch-binding outer membrane protein, SusD/RagB family
MKTRLKYISIIFAIITVANISCKDYLLEDNKTGATEDVIYSTRSGIDGLLAESYSFLRGWYGKQGGIYLSEGGCDIWLTGFDNQEKGLADYTSITPEVINGAMDPCFDEYWELLYSAINTCNLGIKNVDLISTGVLSETEKNIYTGELKALRAFYYWHLVETWGAVQINREPIKNVLTTAKRDSEEDVYTFMLEDIDDAITRLADKTAKTGHINLWAAKAMRARFLLYKASKFGDNQAYIDAAAEAEEVIAGSGLSFFDNYADCWNGPHENGVSNQEVIWWVDYSEILENNIMPKRLKTQDGDQLNWSSVILRDGTNATGGNASHLFWAGVWNFVPGLTTLLVRTKDEASKIVKYKDVDYNLGTDYQAYSRGYQEWVPSGFLLDLFNDATDQRYQASFRDTWYIAKCFQDAFAAGVEPPDGFANLRDTAIYMSKAVVTPPSLIERAKNRYVLFTRTDVGKPDTVFPLYQDDAGKAPTEAASSAGYENCKGDKMFIGLKKNDDLNSPTIGILGGRDSFVFRLSEMYLIAAEAYMMSGSSGEAITKLNELRSARAIPSGSDVNNLSSAEEGQVTSADINVILDERARELCGEQQRWFDLKRTGTLIERVNLHNSRVAGNVQEYHMLRPIPVTQMDAITNKTAGPDPNGFWQNPGY